MTKRRRRTTTRTTKKKKTTTTTTKTSMVSIQRRSQNKALVRACLHLGSAIILQT